MRKWTLWKINVSRLTHSSPPYEPQVLYNYVHLLQGFKQIEADEALISAGTHFDLV